MGIDNDGVKPFITEEELKAMVNVSHEEGVLEMEEREIINNVFQFGDMQAKEAMIQRLDMVAIDIKDIIFLSDEEIENFDIKDYVREAFFTYEFKKITQLLEEMKKEKTQMAIVVDEYGGTAGLLTIEDLVEVIVGDIDDEYDEEEEEIVKINDNEYLVEGSTKISDVNEQLGINLESEEFDSIGGFIIGYLKRIPEENEIIEVEDVKFKVESIDKNRINKIRIFV